MTNESGVYKLVWDNCPNYYIGQAANLRKRLWRHIFLLKRGEHPNPKVQALYKLHGEPKMEIIQYCNKEDLDKYEQALIDANLGLEYCCNINKRGTSTKGYKHNDEQKKRIGELSKQKVFTEEYRAKLRARPVNKTFGIVPSEETRKKMSIARKGKPKSEEWKAKISESNKRADRKNRKPLINETTGECFACVGDAAKHYGINRHTLSYRLNRNQSFLKYADSIATPANVRRVFLSNKGTISTKED